MHLCKPTVRNYSNSGNSNWVPNDECDIPLSLLCSLNFLLMPKLDCKMFSAILDSSQESLCGQNPSKTELEFAHVGCNYTHMHYRKGADQFIACPPFCYEYKFIKKEKETEWCCI